MVADTDAKIILTDLVAVAASLASISMRLVPQRRRSDLDMMVAGSPCPVFVHNTVDLPFHKVRRVCLPAFFAGLFSFRCLKTV